MRRQIGLLAYAGVDEDKRGTSVTRTAAASYALWSRRLSRRRAPFRPTIKPFDFEVQAQLAARCLLGIG